jgi:hypothetical protein
MMAALSIILEPDLITKFVRQFLRDFIRHSNDEKTDIILVFGECCKNVIQATHVYSQRYPKRPTFFLLIILHREQNVILTFK